MFIDPTPIYQLWLCRSRVFPRCVIRARQHYAPLERVMLGHVVYKLYVPPGLVPGTIPRTAFNSYISNAAPHAVALAFQFQNR